ncbi:hypothetical protein ACWA3C_29580, partial [Pseudomonas chlororaphis]
VSLTFGTTPAGMGLLHYLSMINSSDCSLEKLEGIKGGAQETRRGGCVAAAEPARLRSIAEQAQSLSP